MRKLHPVLMLFFFIVTVAFYLTGARQVLPGLSLITSLLFPLMAVFFAYKAFAHLSLQSRQGRAVFALFLGLACLAAGETLFALFDIVFNIDPYPSVADVFYLLSYPCFFVGIWTQSTLANVKVDTKFVFMASVPMTLLTAVVFYFIIILGYDSEASIVENIFALFYGIGDLMLVVLTGMLLVLIRDFSGGKLFTPWFYFSLGLFVTLIADVVFAMFTPEYTAGISPYRYTDLLWIAGFGLWAHSFYSLDDTLSEEKEKIRGKLSVLSK